MSAVFDYAALQAMLGDWPQVAPPKAALDGILERLRQILALAFAGDGAGRPPAGDTAPLLRHALRRESLRSGTTARLRVPRGGGWPQSATWRSHGILAQPLGSAHFLLEATPWEPNWLAPDDRPVFEDAFAERQVRHDNRRPIDPFLQDATGYESYFSPGQREAVRSAFLAPPGETLIVALPTGSGKSFVAQAPLLVRGPEAGLTLCIVPTTALVLDQARIMAGLLKARRPGVQPSSLAWHADLSAEERLAIKRAIRRGRQGILYCSPEAATGALLPALFEAARAGLLTDFVIDEAHLLAQWGDGFRPAFQMLAGVRRGLLAACAGRKFRTVLMSATLTPETVKTIDALFGPAKTVQMLAAIHLRPEPQYWIHREDDEPAKQRKVLEALRHAPRPFILYVTKRDDARRWLQILQGEGLTRIACFHGETPDKERRRIIDAWADSRLDGVVATSAFGVGIDKQDVRTVIHATVPETLDRFYQEVGRGGRDGRACSSLLLFSHRDRELAEALSTPTLISDELGFERWSALAASAKALDENGFVLEVDLDVVPPRLSQQSDYNAAWNMRTLIMMARAGLLELKSEPPFDPERLPDESDLAFEVRSEAYWEGYFRKAVVRLHYDNYRSETVFNAQMRLERSRALQAAQASSALLDRLLLGRAEVSALLDDLYRSHAPRRSVVVSRACGGCPAHRRFGVPNLAYAEPLPFGIENVVPPNLTALRRRFPHLKLAAPIILPLPPPWDENGAMAILDNLAASFGVREIAVPDQVRRHPMLARLHRRLADRVLLVQSLEEEAACPSAYPLARATLLVKPRVPPHIWLMERPVHFLLAPADTPDPHHPERLLADTGGNVLSYEVFMQGVRA
jgi:ATP-dependent DNA helicase RecQ